MTTHLSPAVRIEKARTALLLDHPFFGSLLFRLKTKVAHSIETMATDGISIFYNPGFVEGLTSGELVGVLAHEVMHPALQHHTRRGGRNHRRWNMACDYAINPLLLDAGLALPGDALLEEQFRGMSAEAIYNRIAPEENKEHKDQPAKSTDASGGEQVPPQPEIEKGNPAVRSAPSTPSTPGGFAQVLDASVPGKGEGEKTVAEQARDWKIAVEQAEALVRLSGKLPAGASRAIEQAEAAGVDWRELLRRAWSDTAPADYCWMPPNRRHVWTGLYLPGLSREGVGEIVIAIDCSGSVNTRQLGLFEVEVRSIVDGQRPSRVHVLYFDTEVQKSEVYLCGEPLTLSPVGGGGTDFRPCFAWVEEQGIDPQVMIFFTDLWGRFPSQAPCYPVLWASTEAKDAPFGQVIPMQAA